MNTVIMMLLIAETVSFIAKFFSGDTQLLCIFFIIRPYLSFEPPSRVIIVHIDLISLLLIG